MWEKNARVSLNKLTQVNRNKLYNFERQHAAFAETSKNYYKGCIRLNLNLLVACDFRIGF